MRNFRNPRFAPEWLEARLSPSAIVPAAAVSTASAGTATPPVYPHPGDAPLPNNPPTTPLPTGPSGPA